MTKKQFLLNVIAFILAWLALPFLLLFSDACPKGMVDYEGNCADMPSPDTATIAPMIGTMSDEKPPKDRMPSYEREGIKADTPPSLASDDAKLDQEKAQADAQGKKAAHVPQ